MKLGTIKTISKEDLSKIEKVPAWIDGLLQPLNQFISNVAVALKGNLTFDQNFLCKTKTITLANGTEQTINPDTNLKVVGVACFNAGGRVIDKFGWRQLTNGQIGVTINYVTGTTSECEIIIFLRDVNG